MSDPSPSSYLPDEDIRPVVRTGSQRDYGLWAFLVILLLGGFWLFSTLREAREAAQVPSVLMPEESASRLSSPPPLVLPPSARELPRDIGEETAPLSSPAAAPPVSFPAPPRRPPAVEPPQGYAPPGPPPAPVTSSAPSSPAVVYQRRENVDQGPGPFADDGGVVKLANPSMTVPQGTIIPAVLETAFDSTRAGRVRALVQRDIRGFDGTRVLVPRGSRLFGEYEAGLNPGERRAAITWTRLLTPDGISISLDSPASDPLGRGGVEGDVNSRFFSRFGGALLQTFLGIGTGIAIGEATGGGGTVVALPGSTQNISSPGPNQARPVLEIDHGTSVTVYVARDLDFSNVER